MQNKTLYALYTMLGVVNTVLLAATQQNLVPVQYAHYVALASIVVAGALKSFLPAAATQAPNDPPAPPAGA